MTRTVQRGPIAATILARTNEDIRNCGNCEPCCIDKSPAMDLTVGELLQMAARDDHSVFTSKTLWNIDASMVEQGSCQEGINVLHVLEALKEEARLRGYSNGDWNPTP